MSDRIDETDRLTFWRGWYNQAKGFPAEQRLAWYDAVLAFAFDGIEPEEPNGDLTRAIASAAVESVRATINISRKRRQIGSKGGANSKRSESNGEANAKQTGSKTKAKRNQEQVQEQEQDQDQDHIGNRSLVIASPATAARGRGKKPPTISQFREMAKVAGVPVDYAEQLHAELEASGWIGADGLPVRNAMIFLKSAWNSQKKSSAARVNDSGLDVASMATNGAARADGTFACPGIDD